MKEREKWREQRARDETFFGEINRERESGKIDE